MVWSVPYSMLTLAPAGAEPEAAETVAPPGPSEANRVAFLVKNFRENNERLTRDIKIQAEINERLQNERNAALERIDRLKKALENAVEYIAQLQRQGCQAGPVAVPSDIADGLIVNVRRF